ncbi:MAG: sigma-70 family RNA polymerase sigma factor [Candidatus Eremiobacteraeota bacterium]|nr:sigma-70 family RNA polymerase sigma factor [Candidatus Eremiobacteraeota bacterium]
MTTAQVQQQFQALVEEHKKILYKVCHSYARNAVDREDLAQEIVVQLWRSFPSFDSQYRFATWMYRVALNVAISFLRREHTRSTHIVAGDERLLEVPEPYDEPAEAVSMLRMFIETLQPLDRGLMLLYLDEYGYAEIARIMGITETNVATKISRLKKALKTKFLQADLA